MVDAIPFLQFDRNKLGSPVRSQIAVLECHCARLEPQQAGRGPQFLLARAAGNATVLPARLCFVDSGRLAARQQHERSPFSPTNGEMDASPQLSWQPAQPVH